MKRFILIMISLNALVASAQSQKYPNPEYNNEIYLFNKDSAQLSRLEKGSSKFQSNTKMGGMGGSETGYLMEGERSAVRLKSGNHLSFVFFAGDHGKTSSPEADSAMMASGVSFSGGTDPMSMLTDPSRTTSLYSVTSAKGKRNIVIKSYPGMKMLGKSKKESTNFTLSVKKIRDGYYQLDVDKPLPKGEYAFVMNSMTSTDGSVVLFAFGID
jgi:hypothetical protein